MEFKFLIVLIFIVKVNSQIETTTPFSSEHSVLSFSRGTNFCEGTLQIIPPLPRRDELIEEFE